MTHPLKIISHANNPQFSVSLNYFKKHNTYTLTHKHDNITCMYNPQLKLTQTHCFKL